MAASDMSVLRSPIQIGVTGFLQLLQSYHVGTDEVKQALVQHCDFIMECKVCRSLFRGLPNFLAHKRHYCEDPRCSGEVSLENVRIVQPSSTTSDCPISSYGDESNKSRQNDSESVLFKSFMKDSSPEKLPPAECGVVDGAAPIPCQGICGFSSFLIHHNLVDKSGRVCSLCKYSTPDVKRMRNHMHVEHLKKHCLCQCSHCLKVFCKPTALQSHLILEHNIPNSEAHKAANSRKTKVEKYVINGKVYNPPVTKPQGDFKDVSRQIVLKIFDSLDILNFTDREQYRAKCRLHPDENLDGFQSIRRHLVDFHLKSNNICMFCDHSNSSFGHLVKHMVMAHDLTIDRINGMKEEIKQHFSKGGTKKCVFWERENEDPSEVNNLQEKCVENETANGIKAEKCTSPLKREHVSGMQNSSMEPKKKKRKIEFSLPNPVKPTPASNTKTWFSFIRHNKFFLENGKCRYCDVILKGRRMQGKHLLNKHLRKQVLYQCKKCGLVFQEVRIFTNHVKSCHGITIEQPSDFEVQKFVLQNGQVFDIPERIDTALVDNQASANTMTASDPAQSADSCSMSSTVLYSEREMLLAIITCMYIIKFKDVSCQVAHCVHHTEVVLPSFAHVIEHLVSNHIKDDYTCFMCPFRRKDATSLVKHMTACHHMSLDRIQRLREKIKMNLNLSKLTDSRKLNFAAICLRATDQIIAVLNSSRDGRGSESLMDDGSILNESSVAEKLHMSPESKPTKCFFSSRDLVLALIDCLDILRFHARPKTYQPNSKYVAKCLLHPSHQMDGFQSIIAHVTGEHLKVSYRCLMCGVPTHTLEYLAEHLIRIHGLDVRKILNMREAIRYSLLQKSSIADNTVVQTPSTAEAPQGGSATVRGIPCPRCGKKFTTFKRITKHLKESHLVRPMLVARLVEKLRLRMQRKEQKCKAKHTDGRALNETVQTKSGRIIRKISDVHSDGDTTKDSMFGLEDVKCTICGRSYPATWAALKHVTNVHKMTTKESRKYISQPLLSLKSLNNHHDTESIESDESNRERNDSTHRLRRNLAKTEDADQVASVSLFGVDDLPCNICLKSFPKRAGLVDHYMRHHSMTRSEVYDMLQQQRASKNGSSSTKSEARGPEVENKRKQLMPKKCESDVKMKPDPSDQCKNSEEINSETPTEISCDKTLKIKLKVLENVDLMKINVSSSAQDNSHEETRSMEDGDCKQQQVDDHVDETNNTNCSGNSSSNQSSANSSTGEITFIAANISSECKKHPTKGLYQCIDCSKFFAGSEAETDAKQPQCKKCRKVVTN